VNGGDDGAVAKRLEDVHRSIYMCVMGCLKEIYWSRRAPHLGLRSWGKGAVGGDDGTVTNRLEDVHRHRYVCGGLLERQIW